MRVILVTGEPGVGKTTIVRRVCDHYSSIMRIEGITTREIRENDFRAGFKITNIATGEEGWLARKNHLQGPRVGSYVVITEDLERIGARALGRAAKSRPDIVIVDEIGPMEMTSRMFRKAIAELFDLELATIATVRLGSHYPEVEKIRRTSTLLQITKANREEIYQKLLEKVDDWTLKH